MSRIGAGPSRTEESTFVATAQGRDESAFAEMVERYRRELQVHCYRMLGSFQESEDLVQETFLRAWRSRGSFQGRSTFRAWLYRIATNVCLDFLDRHPRRPRSYEAIPGAARSVTGRPPPMVPWLQPYPDRLLDPVAPSDAEPDAVVVAKETIELAFLVSIQQLPPRQRAVLILRDVLGWSANDTATLLEGSVASVKSALQRARATLREHLSDRREEWVPSADPTEQERALLQRYIDAHERGDASAVAELLAEEVRLTMPPHPQWFFGREAIVGLHTQVFDPASERYHGHWWSLPTRANRQPAVAHYCQQPTAEATKTLPGEYRAQVLDVLRVEGGKVAEITSFEPIMFRAFGLPLTLDEPAR
ncbi:MAG TPA: sigma-70 family RNA polymerase sigma factor [Jiangellaceae bacterium]|nr:sigma-70 family RNA polymerase sigma factor [Jiangellaceae bacterium]